MDANAGILQNAQRLRYEALSNFAADLNKASKHVDVGNALASHVKYIIDFYSFRLSNRYKGEDWCFEVFRGECVFFKQKRDIYWEFENAVLLSGLPVSYTPGDFENNIQLKKALFGHTKIAAVYSLPVAYVKQHEVVVSIAVKYNIRYIDTDFRFLKAIADLVANKLIQLDLLKKIESKNKELKAKNTEITKLNHDLEKMVTLRTAELTSTNEELRTLFYRTSHDFRAPLANILGLANVAKVLTTDAEALNLFEKCKEVVHKLDAMLGKLNVLSHYTFENEIGEVDFNGIVEGLKLKYAAKLKEIAGRIICDINLDGDAHLSNQHTYVTILDNLLENSLGYHNGNLLVQLYVFRFKDDLVIKFSDNGQGIPAHTLSRIYDMYYRGHPTSTGSGLGLYVVRKLVKSLNGDIFVHSKPLSYTHFIIKVPFIQTL